MKKLAIILAAAVMVLSLAACGNRDNKNNTGTNPNGITNGTTTNGTNNGTTTNGTNNGLNNGTTNNGTNNHTGGNVGNDLENAVGNAGNAVRDTVDDLLPGTNYNNGTNNNTTNNHNTTTNNGANATSFQRMLDNARVQG